MTEFQKEAKELLEPKDDEQSIVQLDVLQKCLERGAAFGIDLPEIARLKLVIISLFSINRSPLISQHSSLIHILSASGWNDHGKIHIISFFPCVVIVGCLVI